MDEALWVDLKSMYVYPSVTESKLTSTRKNTNRFYWFKYNNIQPDIKHKVSEQEFQIYSFCKLDCSKNKFEIFISTEQNMSRLSWNIHIELEPSKSF